MFVSTVANRLITQLTPVVLACAVLVAAISIQPAAQAQPLLPTIANAVASANQDVLESMQLKLYAAVAENAGLSQGGLSPFRKQADFLPLQYFKQAVMGDEELPPEPAETEFWKFWEPADNEADANYNRFQGTLVWPMKKFRLSSGFGTRWGRNHNGVDLTAPYGSTILSAGSGTVVSAGFQQGYGRLIVIDHGNGIKTRYAHLSRHFVKAGDFVFAHQMIGAVGMTGHTSGPHLHFEVLANGVFKNPMYYLAKRTIVREYA